MTKEQDKAAATMPVAEHEAAMAALRADGDKMAELLAAERDKAQEEARTLTDDLATRGETIADLQAQLEKVAAERDKLAKAKSKTNVVAGEQSRTARVAKAMDAPDDEEAHKAQIDAFVAGSVELVFSDGKHELVGLRAVTVADPKAWAPHPLGKLLRERIELGGPAAGMAAYDVRGVAMFVDGKQVAWCQFHDPVSIHPGGTVELRDAIIF